MRSPCGGSRISWRADVCTGVVWPAGAGETTSLSFSERMKHSEAVVKESKGRTTVLIGVHRVNKFEAVGFSRAIRRTSSIISFDSGGRPTFWRCWL